MRLSCYFKYQTKCTYTEAHRGTYIQKHTHTQEHTHTGTHIQEPIHTEEHTHIWTGQGSHHRGPRGAGSGALMVCRAAPHARLPTPGAAPAHLPPALPPSGAKVQCRGRGCTLTRGAHLQGVELVWTQPSEFCSSVLGLTWPSRVGTATEHKRSLCSH